MKRDIYAYEKRHVYRWYAAQQAAQHNILWVSYEEMKSDLPSVVARVRVMAHIYLSHVTRMNESCHTYE